MEYICKRCNNPVKNRKDYEIFEGMHWLCFHLEYEHGEYDVDEPCDDPSCPWNRIKGRDKEILHQNSNLILESENKMFKIYFTIKEIQKQFLPSVRLNIFIKDPHHRLDDFEIWLEADELQYFSTELSKLACLKVDSCSINSMSPNEFILKIRKVNRRGYFEISYEKEIVTMNQDAKYKSIIRNGFNVETQRILNFSNKIRTLLDDIKSK